MNAAVGTHIGLRKKRNEDSYYLGKNLAAVADGLGGHVAGDIASSVAIDAVRAFDQPCPPDSLAGHLGQAFLAANLAMQRRISVEPAVAGMGTTLVAVAWGDGRYALANIGDSRAYLLRGGTLTQLTDDHVYSRVVAHADLVPILPERLARFLDGRIDGRAPDVFPIDVHPGDRLLLCSDGLSSYVDRDVIAAELAADNPQHVVDRLIALTLEADAPDNVTVIVLDA